MGGPHAKAPTQPQPPNTRSGRTMTVPANAHPLRACNAPETLPRPGLSSGRGGRGAGVRATWSVDVPSPHCDEQAHSVHRTYHVRRLALDGPALPDCLLDAYPERPDRRDQGAVRPQALLVMTTCGGAAANSADDSSPPASIITRSPPISHHEQRSPSISKSLHQARNCSHTSRRFIGSSGTLIKQQSSYDCDGRGLDFCVRRAHNSSRIAVSRATSTLAYQPSLSSQFFASYRLAPSTRFLEQARIIPAFKPRSRATRTAPNSPFRWWSTRALPGWVLGNITSASRPVRSARLVSERRRVRHVRRPFPSRMRPAPARSPSSPHCPGTPERRPARRLDPAATRARSATNCRGPSPRPRANCRHPPPAPNPPAGPRSYASSWPAD